MALPAAGALTFSFDGRRLDGPASSQVDLERALARAEPVTITAELRSVP